jgi:hypothetical protein
MHQTPEPKKSYPGKPGVDKLLALWNENPIMVMFAGAAVMTATSKLIDAVSGIQGRRAYAKMANRKR